MAAAQSGISFPIDLTVSSSMRVTVSMVFSAIRMIDGISTSILVNHDSRENDSDLGEEDDGGVILLGFGRMCVALNDSSETRNQTENETPNQCPAGEARPSGKVPCFCAKHLKFMPVRTGKYQFRSNEGRFDRFFWLLPGNGRILLLLFELDKNSFEMERHFGFRWGSSFADPMRRKDRRTQRLGKRRRMRIAHGMNNGWDETSIVLGMSYSMYIDEPDRQCRATDVGLH